MLKNLFYRFIIFSFYCSAVGFVLALFQKDSFIDSLSETGIETLFERYGFLNALYDWPVVIIVIVGSVWLAYKQFHLSSKRQKCKVYGAAFVLLWLLTLGYVACFSYSII